MKNLDKFLYFIDAFIPKSMMKGLSYGDRQKARLIVTAGFFGLFVPFFLLNTSAEYPDRYIQIFYALWALAFYAMTAFRLFKSSLKVTGAICSLGLTLILMAFTFYHDIIFSTTFAWFTSSVLIGTFMVGWKWGLLNFFMLFGTLLASHSMFEGNGIVLPTFWNESAWIENLKGDQLLSLIFNTVMLMIFLYTKEKSEEELLETQETVRQQQETLFKKSRMAELGEVSGGIAHEINNPMTIIRANAQKIKRDVMRGDASPEKLTEMATKIESTCDRIVKIIEGLKNYSRDASQDPFEKVSLAQLLGDVKEIFQEKMHHKMIGFELPNVGDEVLLMGRYGQLYQVLVNLINNAIDALGDSDDPSSKEKFIKLEYEMNIDDSISLRVIDTGPGIPKDLKEKVFQPFFTTKPLGKGTGLGLSISYGLMKEQGGALLYERLENETCFTLIIPLFVEESENVEDFDSQNQDQDKLSA